MIYTIKNPCNEIFYNLVADAKEDIKLVAPFVKSGIVNKILQIKQSNSSLSLVTTSNIGAFASGGTDIEVVNYLLDNNMAAYNYQSLHAKIYVFDNTKALVTSANLTHNGLHSNYEYGIFLDKEDEAVNSIVKDHREMIFNDLCGKFKYDDVKRIKETIAELGQNPRINVDTNGEIILSKENLPNLNAKLNGWQKNIFAIIESIEGSNFSNQELQSFVPYLKQLYPNSKTPDRTMSRVLQELRDMGLIKFVSRGQYKKLWE